MPEELTTEQTLTLIVSQARTVYIIGPGQAHWLGYLAVSGQTYRVIGRGSGLERARFTLADVKCAGMRGEEFAVVELNEPGSAN